MSMSINEWRELLLKHDLVGQPLALLARTHIEADFPAAGCRQQQTLGPVATILARHDLEMLAGPAAFFGQLRVDTDQLRCIATLGADIEDQREGLADFDTRWIGAKGDHVLLGEYDPADAVAEIERTIGPGRRRDHGEPEGQDRSEQTHRDTHRRRPLALVAAEGAQP